MCGRDTEFGGADRGGSIVTGLLTEDVLVRGNTDLMYVSLVTTPAVGWGARSRLARTLTEGLHRAGIVSGRAHAGSEGIFVTATWRTDPRAVDELVSRLQTWRNTFDDNMIAPASPPTSPAELITALTFDAHDETDPTEGELTSILTTLSFDVVVGGGDCESALRSARDRICDAANTAVENGVKPKRESGRRTPRRPDVPTRRWAQVPVRSSWVRWYRFIDPPTDPGERLARSLVNVAFGGVYGSHLVDCVRRQRGLSYSPQSTLLQRDGRHLLVVDVQTTRGDENACDAHDETDPTEGELTSILTTLSFDVVVGGGDCESALRSARDRICDAANTAVENGVKPKRESGRRTPRRPDVPTRRWAQVPVRSSWVRWYRFIDPPTDPGERLARSLVNVAFGGVYGSHLVDCVRRQRGLSYSPQSTLLQRDGRHLLVVDVQTTRGDENACDDAIRTALDQFAHRKLTRHRMVDAARYLIGRTIVDRDSLQSAVDERAALYEGSLDSALDTTGSPEDLVARADADTLTRTVETLYAPDGFGAVVLSPDRSNGKWVEL